MTDEAESPEGIPASEAVVEAFRRREMMAMTGAERLRRAAELQREAMELLKKSPEGYQRYLRRTYRERRMEKVNGRWIPVCPRRRALLPPG